MTGEIILVLIDILVEMLVLLLILLGIIFIFTIKLLNKLYI